MKIPSLALALFLFALVAPSVRAAEPEKPSESVKPQVLVLTFRADWCSECRKVEPTIAQTAAAYANKSVLFLKMDLTNENTKRQSAMLASALGLEKIWQQNQKTGYAILVNPATKNSVGVLYAAQNAQDMAKSLDGALLGAQMMAKEKAAKPQ